MSPSTDEIYDRMPGWVTTGAIDREDANLLADLVRAVAPRVIVEVGTASGFSAAIIAAAIDEVRQDWRLETLDIGDRCYFDPTRAVGTAVGEMLGNVPALTVHGGSTVGDLAAILSGDRIDLAFIDADHSAPHVAIDLLGLLPHLAPNAIVVLDDLTLPFRPGYAHQNGPRDFFRAWRGLKWQDMRAPDLGILRITTPEQALEDVCAALSRHWDAVPTERDSVLVTRLIEPFLANGEASLLRCRERLCHKPPVVHGSSPHTFASSFPFIGQSIVQPEPLAATSAVEWIDIPVCEPRRIQFVAAASNASPMNPGAKLLATFSSGVFETRVDVTLAPRKPVFVDIDLPPLRHLSIRLDGRSGAGDDVDYSAITIEPFVLSH